MRASEDGREAEDPSIRENSSDARAVWWLGVGDEGPLRLGGFIAATTLTWATFGVMQVILLAMGGAFLYRARRNEGVAGNASILMAAGGLLILANAWWFATGGPDGDSFIPMRGGVLGAWLSVATGVELFLIGATALILSTRG